MNAMNRWVLTWVCLAWAVPVWADEVEPPHLSVVGEAEVLLEPDYIEWVVDIRTRDEVPKIARDVNNTLHESLLKIADKAGIDEDQVHSGELAYEQLFGQDRRSEPNIDRYTETEVTRRVTLVMREMDDCDQMLDAVHSLGVFYAMRRKSTQYDDAVKRLQVAALKDARIKAVAQAAALGQNIGKAIDVEVLPYLDTYSGGGLFGSDPPIEEDDKAAGPDGKIHLEAFAHVRFRLE